MPVIIGAGAGSTAVAPRLFIRGAPDAYNSGTLHISGPPVSSGDISLFMASPPSLTMPLSFVAIPPSSGNTDLYINGGFSDARPAFSWSPTVVSEGSDVTNTSATYDRDTNKLNIQYNNTGLEGYIFFRAEHRGVGGNVISSTVGSATGVWQTGASASPYNPSSPFTSGGEDWQLRAVTGGSAGSGYMDLDLSSVIDNFASNDHILLRWDSENSVWSDPPNYTTTSKVENTYVYGSGMQDQVDLVINPTANSGFPPDTPLPGVISQNGAMGLVAKVNSTGVFPDDPPLPGVLGQNGATSLSVSANSNIVAGSGTLHTSGTSTYGVGKGFAPITIFHFGSETRASGNHTLFVQKDFNASSGVSLHINSRGGTGFLPVSIGGNVVGTGNIPLHINTDQNNNTNLFTEGFLE